MRNILIQEFYNHDTESQKFAVIAVGLLINNHPDNQDHFGTDALREAIIHVLRNGDQKMKE